MTRRLGVCLLAVLLGGAVPAAWASQQSPGVAETYREAYDFGFKDGRAAGLQDRRDGSSFDFRSKKQYKEPNHGFDAVRHDLSVYTVAYRRGFEDGYEEGFATTQSEKVPVVNPDRPSPAPSRPTPAPQAPKQRAEKAPDKVPAGTLVVVELMETLSTKYNERGDQFTSRVTQDVRLQGSTLIPEGSEVIGSVSYLKRAGRIRGRAQISLRFEELRLVDGRHMPLEASLVDLEAGSEEKLSESEGAIVAPSSKGADASKVGKASGVGALVGVMIGRGKEGAGVGAAAGAVAGLATVLVSRGRDAVLESRTQFTIRLNTDLPLSARNP